MGSALMLPTVMPTEVWADSILQVTFASKETYVETKETQPHRVISTPHTGDFDPPHRVISTLYSIVGT